MLYSTKSVRSVWRSTQLTQSQRGFGADIPMGMATGSNLNPPKGNQLGPFRQNAWPPPKMGQAREGGHNPNQALVSV